MAPKLFAFTNISSGIALGGISIPKLVKNEKFKPYRCLGWGGDSFENHKGIDWEANKVRKKLNLNREPTEEEIKNYFEGRRNER